MTDVKTDGNAQACGVPAGDAQDAERAAEEFDRLQQVLLEHIETFIQEQNIGQTDVVELLVTAAVRLRMANYAMFAADPTAAALKFDLDRLRADVEQIVRAAKTNADDYIALVKETRAQEEAE